MVLNCDVLFHDQLLADLLTARDEDALLIAAAGDQVYTDEEMKVRLHDGRVVDIAKTLPREHCDGENVGIAKFGAAGAPVLVDELSRALADGGRRDWLPRAFAGFAQRRPLHVVETRGLPWIEIDSPEDYWRACTDVLPAITTGTRRVNVARAFRGRGRTPPIGHGDGCIMYERFYNLRERPFSLSPDPDYLYPSRVHTEALSHLRYGIEGHAGFVVITGEIGSGKTTLLQTAMRGLDLGPRWRVWSTRCSTRAS